MTVLPRTVVRLSTPIAALILVSGCLTTPPTEPSTEDRVPAAVEPAAGGSAEEPAGDTDSAPVPTAPPEPSSEGASPAVAEIVADLEGLPIVEFFDQSYHQFLLRSPEHLTAIGISEEFDLRNDQLNDLSDEFERETQELELAFLDRLRTYDRAALTPDEQLSYDVYEWYLDDAIRGHAFAEHDYPLHHFIGSYHDELIRLLTELHALDSRQDAEDYVTRLSAVDDQVGQLMEGLERRAEAGVVPPRYIVDRAQGRIGDYLQTSSRDPAAIDAEKLTVYTVFSEGLDGIGELDDDEREALREAALSEIRSSFIPAYVDLRAHLDELAAVATQDAGAWKLPDGDAYYRYRLRNQTTTDVSPDEIHALGLAEVNRIRAEMRTVFDELGYPADDDFGQLMQRAIDEAGYHDIRTQQGKDELIAATEDIIVGAEERIGPWFDLRPTKDVVVIGGPFGGYYVPASADGSRPGAYHMGVSGEYAPKFSMKTIAYHEATPGHHFQIAIAQDLDTPVFRRDVGFNAFAEGWALYAERLVWEMGLYEDDPYGNLGRLQFELLRAVRLVTDTGLHAERWTRQEAKDYMNEALGVEPGWFDSEVERYIVMPAQATGYKVGMLRILELRRRAEDELGDAFDLKAFHDKVLGHGSLPLDILEQVVDDYIAAEKG